MDERQLAERLSKDAAPSAFDSCHCQKCCRRRHVQALERLARNTTDPEIQREIIAALLAELDRGPQ